MDMTTVEKMKFELNEYHRNVPDQDLLDDVKRVADLLETDILSRDIYKKYGKYSSSTIEKRFGSWKIALEKICISSVRGGIKNANNINVNDEQLLEDLRATAKKLGLVTITSTLYDKHGKHGHHIICNRFGKWETALLKAGLEPSGFHSTITTEELLEEIERVWIKLGRQPTTSDIKSGASKYSLNSYVRKFGSWRKALEIFMEYINQDDKKEEGSKQISHTQVDNRNIPNGLNTTIKTRKTKRDINLRLRFLVMQRDNFKCCMCGRSPATTPNLVLHVDHIKPWSKGGETVFENLQTLCSDCNLGKSNLE